VAVATRQPGFTTMLGLIGPIAFHAFFSVAGAGLLGAAKRRETTVPAMEAGEPA
jgi:hypothetical protein